MYMLGICGCNRKAWSLLPVRTCISDNHDIIAFEFKVLQYVL